MAVTDAAPIDTSNAGQLRAWDGDEGDYWADHAEYFDRSIAAYHQRLMAAAAIGERDRVLDVGCGTGQTTATPPARPRPAALGVDLSSRMLDVARRRASDEGVANATFVQADAQIHPFEPAGLRRGDQPQRRDVLRRPRRRVHQHRGARCDPAVGWSS